MLLENRKVLVTGGAGFIGTNLCERLLLQGNKVICLDNFLTGSRQNIQGFLSNPNFTLIEGDICNLSDCQRATAGVDVVLHQAALGSVPRSIENPIRTNEINISGFLNMLVATRDAKVKRFVYAASSSTYGDHPDLPKEEDKIGKPLSPYAVTKYVNELYADNFARLYNMEVIGLRYFNVFGRRQSPQGAYAAVIPKFIAALMRHEAPVIYGDGLQSRDFTYIENVLQANQLAATVENPAALNQVYNVAYGERTTLQDLVKHLTRLLGKYDADIAHIKAKHGDPRQGDIKHSLASVEKAKQLLGYNPKHNFEQGLRETVDWFWARQKA
ncbi:MAG: SDR family oxidoreductase [Bernardetiaceae bacterium]|nr:SDR family oxidoreductase [Bernardetiaceae bacterium]